MTDAIPMKNRKYLQKIRNLHHGKRIGPYKIKVTAYHVIFDHHHASESMIFHVNDDDFISQVDNFMTNEMIKINEGKNG